MWAMTALPMVMRCAAAQWNGLTDEERATLCIDRVFRFTRAATTLAIPIWQAIPKDGARCLTLLSVKEDVEL